MDGMSFEIEMLFSETGMTCPIKKMLDNLDQSNPTSFSPAPMVMKIPRKKKEKNCGYVCVYIYIYILKIIGKIQICFYRSLLERV